MNKIIVSLYVPAVSLKSDLYIPDFLLIGDIIPLLAEAAEELSDYEYSSSGDEVLCSKNKNIVLDESKTLRQCGVVNGEQLVLI